MMIVQACAVFYRAFLEWREGEASANKYLDRDRTESLPLDMAAPERLAQGDR
jgi:hypothetical protein